MASCWSGCWIGFIDSLRSVRRTLYLTGRSGNRARYNEAKATVEFETLIDDDDCEFETAPSFTRRLLTEEEQHFVNQRRYDQLVHKQRQIDQQIDARLRQEEEEIKKEEEALYEAKRQAAKAAKQNRNYEDKKPTYQNYNPNKQTNSYETTNLSSWTSDDGLSVDSAELDAEDFDSFLEKVKARSLNASNQNGEVVGKSKSNGLATNGWDSFTNSVEPAKVPVKSSIDAFKILDLSPVESEDRGTDVER